MSKIYQVIWAPSAKIDLSEIVRFIANRSQPAAKSTLKKIRTSASKLKQFPKRGRIVAELERQSVTLYRELIIDRWRLIYRVTETTVYVVAVIDSRRNVEDILLQRLLRQ